MGVAPPPSVSSGVIDRVRSDMRSQRAARGAWPHGELSFSIARTREFERNPLPLLLRCHERFGPVFTIRLLYARQITTSPCRTPRTSAGATAAWAT
jgi:hypothetical protein